jgi:hypothetical protein
MKGENMEKKYEYMLYFWGGIHNEGNPLHGVEKEAYYFETEKDREIFLSFIEKIDRSDSNGGYGLMYKLQEGYLTHKRTVCVIDLKYKEMIYNIECDFGYEYGEESAKFMFYEGNYSCDCNKSLFIQRQCDENFPFLDCGDEIEIVKFEIEYRD